MDGEGGYERETTSSQSVLGWVAVDGWKSEDW